MSTIPIHHSSEHAAGPGADPESDHGEGQLKDGCSAQVSDTVTQKHCEAQTRRPGKANISALHLFRLCSLEGVTVSSAGELETGRCYVAVGTERFKKLPYVELLVSKATERYFYERFSVKNVGLCETLLAARTK